VIVKSTLAKRIVEIAKRLRKLVDELFASVGELAQVAEDYERERALCLRCGAPLDAKGRCPVCFERDRAKLENDEI